MKGGLAALALSAGAAAYGFKVESGWVDMVALSLTLPNLPKAFHGYRLAQISDIHIGTTIKEKELLEAVRLINGQQPDIVAITGDFVTYAPEEYAGSLAGPLRQLTAPDGVIGVLGNHDYWTDSQAVRRIVSQSQVIDLNNDVYSVEREGAVLHFGGVDDVWEGQDRLDRVLKRLPSTGASILLAHEPDFADVSAATERFDLQLSGHSHGGQVVIPFAGPPITPYLAWKYPIGRYQVGKMIQYTNRGIGTTRMQIRLNCRPEITIFTLISPQV